MKKGMLWVLFGAALGMMLSGCGQQVSGVESGKKAAEISEAAQSEEEKESKAEATSGDLETEGEKDGGVGTKTEEMYERYFDKKLSIDGNREKFQILRNSKKADDVRMMVGKASVALKRVSVDAGYAQVRVKTCDCTGDGRDDIVLLLYGGASGAYHELQVLTEEQGKWREVPFPEELWEENFISFEKAGKKMKIGVSGTKEEKIVVDSLDAAWGTKYRICKVDKDGRMTIVYQISRGDDGNNIAGKVKLTMCYDAAAKTFKIGKTSFLF